jgi:hypothetical protein
LQGPAEQLSDVSYIQPSHQIETMHFDRTDAEFQHLGDLTVRMPKGYQAENVALPGREAIGIEFFMHRLDSSAQSSSCAHQLPLIVNSRESSKGMNCCKRNCRFVQRSDYSSFVDCVRGEQDVRDRRESRKRQVRPVTLAAQIS